MPWKHVTLTESGLTRCEIHGSDVGAVRIDPVVEVDALAVKQVLAELLRRVGLGGDGVATDAGVVDQDAEALLAGLDLLDQLGDVVLAGDVEAAQRDDVALDVLSVRLLHLVELVFAATCDVDLRNFSKAVQEETLQTVVGD